MSIQQRKKVAIIGAGPSGMMAAWFLAPHCDVLLFDRNSRPGKKFLVAGKGGLNLTHDENPSDFIQKYHPSGFLDPVIAEFDNTAFRKWLLDLGIKTFTGSSGKVFPEKEFNASDCLKAIFSNIIGRGVTFYPNHTLLSVSPEREIVFSIDKPGHAAVESGHNPHKGHVTYKPDYIILALGGASWQITGSDGSWTRIVENIGVNTLPFKHSNCGINISWNDNIKLHHSGKPLKNVTSTVAGSKRPKVLGEALITETGLQGTAIYPLIPEIRQCLDTGMKCELIIDFKPRNNEESLLRKINENTKPSEYKEIFHLDGPQLSVIKAFVSKSDYLNPRSFCRNLKHVLIPIDSLPPIDECISVVGGIPIQELNSDLSFRKHSFLYAIGEMVNWDAPTGGYLLQACFSMGAFVAHSILQKSILLR